MDKLRFLFDPQKFCQAVAYLLSKVGPCDRLKLCKLIYLVDRYHFVRYGRPIVGGDYYALRAGPVPSVALDVLEDLAEMSVSPQVPLEYFDMLNLYIEVIFKTPFPEYKSRNMNNTDYLSESDQEALDAIIEKYGKKSGMDLVRITHQHAAWKQSEKPGEIDYRLFFIDEPDEERNSGVPCKRAHISPKFMQSIQPCKKSLPPGSSKNEIEEYLEIIQDE